jgi:O-antigen/teichoic acid export membrane protein
MGNSYGQILRSLKIIGGSSIINVLIGLLRTKIAALIIGPQGMGLIAIYQGILSTASSVLSMGIATAGTRLVAETSTPERHANQRAIVTAMFVGCTVLAVLGAGGLFLCRDAVSVWVVGDKAQAEAIGWLAVGVGLTIASGAQTAFLNGRRELADLARISVWSALLSTVIGTGAVFLLGKIGVVIFVLATPISTFIFGMILVRRRQEGIFNRVPLHQLTPHWVALSKLGAAFMMSGAAGSIAQLLVRSMLLKQSGDEALGQFQAASTIGVTYIGFVLSAMATDFYPRLTEAIGDHSNASRLVNQQAETALLVCGPVFLLMLGLAPLLVQVLYSSEFSQAGQLLRWQILGDVLKVAAWPLGFILLASGNGRNFVVTEAVVNAVFVAVAWIAIPSLGAEAAAIGFLTMYAALFPLVWLLARTMINFRWEPAPLRYLIALSAMAMAAFGLSFLNETATGVFSVTTAAMLAVYGLGRLGQMALLPPKLARLSRACRFGNSVQ